MHPFEKPAKSHFQEGILVPRKKSGKFLTSDYFIQAFDDLIQFFGRHPGERFTNPLN
jgi:hypothetical protein